MTQAGTAPPQTVATLRLKKGPLEHEDYEIRHHSVRFFQDGRVRIEANLAHAPREEAIVTIWLPRDGSTVYKMNRSGDTIDCYKAKEGAPNHAEA